MSGWAFSLGSAAATVALFVFMARSIERVQVRERLWLLDSLVAVALFLGMAALLRGPGVLDGLVAGASVLAGALFVALGVLAPQSQQTPAVEVGRPLPDFTAPDADGNVFEIAGLRGRPILLKFFRGHW